MGKILSQAKNSMRQAAVVPNPCKKDNGKLDKFENFESQKYCIPQPQSCVNLMQACSNKVSAPYSVL